MAEPLHGLQDELALGGEAEAAGAQHVGERRRGLGGHAIDHRHAYARTAHGAFRTSGGESGLRAMTAGDTEG
ncbi:hypothetical protein GCM10022220_03450 [Actinocatenispora rupis]|uniref:Uncharacterized protein n=1 Tax=Actinocatenispora rupis TaxID=519421 RepID=A0A8J3NDA7_9ACTN|nr:hypothetical protein Aru02nite_60280 [Actinocatenispora rupis]